MLSAFAACFLAIALVRPAQSAGPVSYEFSRDTILPEGYKSHSIIAVSDCFACGAIATNHHAAEETVWYPSHPVDLQDSRDIGESSQNLRVAGCNHVAGIAVHKALNRPGARLQQPLIWVS